MLLFGHFNGSSPSAAIFAVVAGPKPPVTGLMPSSCWRPMIRECMVGQPVFPFSGQGW